MAGASLDRVFAVVAAAGSGTRLGEVLPKAFVQVSGRTLLERCLDGLAASESVGHTVVTVSADMLDHARELVRGHTGLWAPMEVSVVLGGVDRVDSVRAGLLELQGRFDDGEIPEDCLVAVHDAARCLTPPDMVRATVDAAAVVVGDGTGAGAVPVVPVTDTVKVVEQVTGGALDGAEVIRSTPQRSQLRAAQTPQVFGLERLLAANRMQQAREELDSAHPTGEPPVNGVLASVTDDSSLLEMAGEAVVVVPGSEQAFKITVPEDLERAERMTRNDGGVR